ncbi:MAG: GNAT family N-acetyltransferase [Bacilli bacterium]|nr:GNAT family N-acetyltransferase [Bacilli bacterium]
MEKFYFEVPDTSRKKDALSYINEFYEYDSKINGVGGLHRYLDDYDGWLKKLEEDYTRIPNEEKVPTRTYFLIRESDNRIIGMINIRLALNEKLKKSGGHIGYSIRPTERRKGYNKINLYLGLKVCQEYGIESVLMDADKDNPASWRTMESLGGKNIREFFDNENSNCIVKDYEINVNESINNNSAIYEPMIKKTMSRK